MLPSTKEPVIGIDLGTMYSCVGIYHQGNVKIIYNNEGERTTPSYVAFSETERLTGNAAKESFKLNPENIIFGAKRLIGRKYDDPKLQQDLKNLSFKVVNYSGKPNISTEFKGEHKLFNPEEISAMVLTKMKEIAEEYLGKKVTNAVISVPACFNNSQRQATLDAAKIAGLNIVKLINEPSAAVVAYYLQKNLKGDKNVLIFDLGSGTLDVSIFATNIDRSGSIFEGISTAGDPHLGGEDFINRMIAHFIEEFKNKYQKDMRSSPKAMRRLKFACEQGKRTLSCCDEARIEIDALFEGIDFYTEISRAKFEEMCMDLFLLTLESVEQALKGARLDKSNIYDVVLVGGSTRIPKIRKLLRKFFNGKKLCVSIDPDEAVAYGAAAYAAMMSQSTNTKNITRMLLVDVNPFSLGIETVGGKFKKIIIKNYGYPAKKSEVFTTYSDNQSSIDIQIFEGESPVAKENHVLGKFQFYGIPPAPKGVPNIKITFKLDANCIHSHSISIINESEIDGKVEKNMLDEVRLLENRVW